MNAQSACLFMLIGGLGIFVAGVLIVWLYGMWRIHAPIE
jgi:hypothetical protein